MWPFKQKSKTIIKIDYLILFAGLILAFILYFSYQGQTTMQASIIMALGLFYTLWGIIHHAREGDFHLEILLEYLLIASLATVLLLSLIFRI